MKRADRAYLAGILDGEGCISVVSYAQRGHSGEEDGRQGWSCTIEVMNTNPELIAWLGKLGGSVDCRERNGNRQTIHVWRIYGRHAKPILQAALPYMKVKRQQAELALEFIETLSTEGRMAKVPSWLVEYRDGLCAEFRVLNRRGATT